MVVLLVVMAVMAVGMSALLPTWRQQAIREKEEELVFRGNQYARALVLYSRKNGNQLPNTIEALYSGKYLRKKYKDPITEDDFGLTPAGQPPGAAGGRGAPAGQAGGGRGASPTQQTGGGRAGGSGLGAPAGSQIVGSIQGVYSKSTDTSIRVYQNQQRYIDWPFTVQTAQLQMGTARGAGPGGQQGRGDGRGGTQGPGRGDGRGGVQGGPPGGGGVRGGGAPGRGGQPGAPGRGGVPVAPGRGRGGIAH